MERNERLSPARVMGDERRPASLAYCLMYLLGRVSFALRTVDPVSLVGPLPQAVCCPLPVTPTRASTCTPKYAPYCHTSRSLFAA